MEHRRPEKVKHQTAGPPYFAKGGPLFLGAKLVNGGKMKKFEGNPRELQDWETKVEDFEEQVRKTREAMGLKPDDNKPGPAPDAVPETLPCSAQEIDIIEEVMALGALVRKTSLRDYQMPTTATA